MMTIGYGIYIIVSAITLYILDFSEKRTAIIKLLIVACLPLVGWFLPILWIKKPKQQSEEQFSEYIDTQQQEYKTRRIDVFNSVDKERELNVVPIDDALSVSYHRERRQALIEVLKQDTIQYIEVLQRAISNEDTETSHYAVSAILEIKTKLLNSLQDFEVKYENESGNVKLSRAYIDVLASYLKSGFLDYRTKRKYQYKYVQVLDHHLKHHELDENLFVTKINTEIDIGNFPDAEQTAIEYLEHFPLSEQAYMSQLKLYFSTRSNLKLQQTLERLKNSPIRLTNQGLTTIRFWSRGVENG